uniref:Uncharacterized protein n=1 Tax=Arundo donax TaxID=35708 RepID=A0A0A8YEA7_ARUDO
MWSIAIREPLQHINSWVADHLTIY